jgi:hypothetical protein
MEEILTGWLGRLQLRPSSEHVFIAHSGSREVILTTRSSLLFSTPSERESGMRGTARLGSTARMERAHSYRARSASKEPT